MVVGAGFELEFVDADGTIVRGPLCRHWNHRFEQAPAVRNFPLFKGQRNNPGARWSASSGHLVGFESWLERDNAILLDYDPHVVAYSSQPFRLHWRPHYSGSEPLKARHHTPDYFARLDDGRGLVVDVRADDRIKPEDAQAFEATESACAEVGWLFRRVGVPGRTLLENVRWLSGYRRPRCLEPAFAEAAMKVFAAPGALFQTAEEIGDRRRVLPTLYHLMWHHVLLVADLDSQLLCATSLVRVGDRPWP